MPRWRRPAGQRAALYAYRTGGALARALPAPLAASGSGPLGAALSRAMPVHRHLVERRMQRVSGGRLEPAALRAAVRRSFASYARYWIECFRLPGLSADEIEDGMVAEGLHHLDGALAAGNGAILALPHVGNWDFGGAWLALRYQRLTVVAEPIQPPELFEWFTARRSGLGLSVVPLGPAAGRAILRALRGNEMVALLCDRDIGGGGVEVEFFGERTTLPAGPAALALRSGAPVLPTALYFEGRSGHRGVIRPPLPVERHGSRRDDVVRLTQALAAELEVLIRTAPDQWHLFQPNWPSDRRSSDPATTLSLPGG